MQVQLTPAEVKDIIKLAEYVISEYPDKFEIVTTAKQIALKMEAYLQENNNGTGTEDPAAAS